MKIDLTLVNDGNVKALAAVEGNAITIRNFKVITGNKGLFVAQPQYKHGEAWQDLIIFHNENHLKNIKLAILEAYKKAVNNG